MAWLARPSMVIIWWAIRSAMSVPLTIGSGRAIPADTGCAQAGNQFARDRPAPPSAAPRSNARRSRFDERMTGQPLIDAFIRKYAETASIPQTFLQPGAGTIDARLDRLLADPQHQCRLGLRQSFDRRSDEHTSELQSLMRISYAVFCLKKQ